MDGIVLIAVDLDGTLLTTEKNLAPEGTHLLKCAHRNGKRIILTTIRNSVSTQSFSQQLHINDPIICCNGAHILETPSGPDWQYHTITLEAAQRIAQLADEHGWELSTTIGSVTYWRQRPGQEIGRFNDNIVIVPTNLDAIKAAPIRMLVNSFEASEKIETLCQSELQGKCRTEIFYNPDKTFHSMVICPASADKGKALEFVLKRLDIAKEQVMAIGDNLADISMFHIAGISVAMGNAPDKVKQEATIVAPANDDEGVAWALKMYKIV